MSRRQPSAAVVAARHEADHAIVCFIDPATSNNFAYWFGRLDPVAENDAQACRVRDLAMNKFAYESSDEREEEVHKNFIEKEKLVDEATHFDIELQNPTAPMPEWMAKRIGIKGRALAGNAVSYGISKAVKLAIVARRRALGLPLPQIRFTHPASKFHTFGLEMPKQKDARKRMAVRFNDAFFEVHGHDPKYAGVWRRYETEFKGKDGKPKKDDIADARMGGISRLIRLRAGMDRKKKKKQQQGKPLGVRK